MHHNSPIVANFLQQLDITLRASLSQEVFFCPCPRISVVIEAVMSIAIAADKKFLFLLMGFVGYSPRVCMFVSSCWPGLDRELVTMKPGTGCGNGSILI
jgi:hypothetical protein